MCAYFIFIRKHLLLKAKESPYIYLLKLISVISEKLMLLVHLNAENMGWNPAQRSDEIQSTPAFPCV
jgi:hypothetical protein